jgi:hypothetical protein
MAGTDILRRATSFLFHSSLTAVLIVVSSVLVSSVLVTLSPSADRSEARLVGDLPVAYAADDKVKELKKRFKRAMKRGDPDAVAAFIKRAAKVDDPEVAPLVVHAAIVIPSAKNYERALSGIRKYKSEETIKALVELGAKSKKYQERVLIVEGFGKRSGGSSGAEEVREAIYQSLRKDPAVHVRVAAIMACSARKEREAVPVLIDHLESRQKERDRDWLECRQALLDLTGENFELIADWRNFWEANKTSLDPKAIGKKNGGKTGRRVKVKKSDDAAEFFGEEIHSQNVVFVIDCSGSMRLYDPHPKYKGKNEERDRERLRRAKQQTAKAILKLKKKSRFNIVAFNSQVFSWKKRVSGASHGNIKKAKKFVQGFNADMFTHTKDALEEAFKDPGVDTIVLLSDGSPYEQNMGPAEAEAYAQRILKRVKDLNASRKLTINTFGFEGQGVQPGRAGGGGTLGGGGANSGKEFLTKLAKRNNGKYKSIK